MKCSECGEYAETLVNEKGKYVCLLCQAKMKMGKPAFKMKMSK